MTLIRNITILQYYFRYLLRCYYITNLSSLNFSIIEFNYLRFMLLDDKFMQRGIELALLGQGNVAPNPMVGAVIVYNRKIIGEGYHQKFGEAHAEVNAFESVEDKSQLSESTIYVTLEPCSHYGKTPPCADLLVKHKFKRVVIGCVDTFSEVQGKGIERLREAGIDVHIGCLENECRELNKQFFTFHEKKRPFIFLKWAQTINGKLDNGIPDQTVTWISSPESKTLVHKWRNAHQAILVGRKTVENDNPSLTVRAITGKNPIRIVLDSELKLALTHSVFNKESKTIVFNLKKSEVVQEIEFVQLEEMTPKSILEALYDLNIISVLIEGGAQTLQSFIDSELWDEAAIITGNSSFEEGTNAPQLKHKINHSFEYFGDRISMYSKNN